jgi:hypothetical protein
MQSFGTNATRWSVGFALCLSLASCCSQEIQSKHMSPSGGKMLVVLRVSCAGFDSFGTEIRLTDAKGRITRGRDQVVASVNGARIIQVTWLDESSAVLFAPNEAQLIIHKAELEGVRIKVHGD